MSRAQIAVWVILLIVFGSLVGLLIYADYYGAVKMSEVLLRILEVSASTIVGAAANALAK